MTVIFNDDELEWIVKEPFNWHMKDGCPEKIKKTLERKLRRLYDEHRLQIREPSQGV